MIYTNMGTAGTVTETEQPTTRRNIWISGAIAGVAGGIVFGVMMQLMMLDIIELARFPSGISELLLEGITREDFPESPLSYSSHRV
jgi:hypothetical protein